MTMTLLVVLPWTTAGPCGVDGGAGGGGGGGALAAQMAAAVVDCTRSFGSHETHCPAAHGGAGPPAPPQPGVAGEDALHGWLRSPAVMIASCAQNVSCASRTRPAPAEIRAERVSGSPMLMYAPSEEPADCHAGQETSGR